MGRIIRQDLEPVPELEIYPLCSAPFECTCISLTLQWEARALHWYSYEILVEPYRRSLVYDDKWLAYVINLVIYIKKLQQRYSLSLSF